MNMFLVSGEHMWFDVDLTLQVCDVRGIFYNSGWGY